MDIHQRILDLAVEIQQIPAPTFGEIERAEFLADHFNQLELDDVQIDEVGNVYGRLPGDGAGQPLVVSAHTDTIFPGDTDLMVTRTGDRISGPGIGDNSVGVASLIGLVWLLREGGINLPGDLWLVGNVGEEGLGDLVGMRAVVDRFQDEALAYIILEGMALGQIYHRGLGVTRYRIRARTQGGHSWVHHGRPSAIHELARLVCQLTEIPLPVKPRTTLNVGKIEGGLSINTIAGSASLELDLRSEDERALQTLVDQVERTVFTFDHPETRLEIEEIGSRPVGGIPADHPLVRLAVEIADDLGLNSRLNIGSTDANIPLSRGLPAVCIGLTTGQGAHTPEEYINTEYLPKGLQQVATLVQRVFELEMGKE